METQELYLSAENLLKIKETIQVELLKRGVTAPIVTMKETIGRGGSHYIEFQTTEFQTVPVMFKRVQVNNFSTAVTKRPNNELQSNLAGEYIAVWITVV